MLRAKDVANFFIIGTRSPANMTNMKVNKLLYYAQAWALVRLGTPLFDEQIEAWQHGPVIPSVYHLYEPFKSDPITIIGDTSFLNSISAEESQLLLDVAREYDGLSAWQLRNQSHGDNEPWSKVYDPQKMHTVISNEMIKECFSKMIPLPTVDFKESFSSIPVTDTISSDMDDEEESAFA